MQTRLGPTDLSGPNTKSENRVAVKGVDMSQWGSELHWVRSGHRLGVTTTWEVYRDSIACPSRLVGEGQEGTVVWE